MTEHIWLCDIYLSGQELTKFQDAMASNDLHGAIDNLKNVEYAMRQTDEVDPGIYADMACLYRMSGDLAKALGLYRQAIQVFREQGFFSGSPGFAGLLMEYAALLEKHEMSRFALEAMSEALNIYERHFFKQSDPEAFAELKDRIGRLQIVCDDFQ